MVIGNGLIASAFKKDYDNTHFVIFASGVSNSMETNASQFEREENLLLMTLKKNKNSRIVYFSSFIDSNILKIKYSEHKRRMEKIILESKNPYIILKLPQVIGSGGNSHSLINFIVTKLKNNEKVNVYNNTYKSIIDVEDVKRIVDKIVELDRNIYIEFPYIEKLSVLEIVKLISKNLEISPKITLVDSEIYDLPELSDAAKGILQCLKIIPEGYTNKTLIKYLKI